MTGKKIPPFSYPQIEVTFPEDAMQLQRSWSWTRGQDETETFDLKCGGPHCDKEFEMDIALWCRCVFILFCFSCVLSLCSQEKETK